MDKFREIIRRTSVVRAPKHRLATFGATAIRYFLVSPIRGARNRCRLRIGEVRAEKPRILVPKELSERFEGFGPDAAAYAGELSRLYGNALRVLEYVFVHNPLETTDQTGSVSAAVARLARQMEESGNPREALLTAPAAGWRLALVKFILEESARSFLVNLRELQEHDFFELENREEKQGRRQVENLFAKARIDRRMIPALGRRLQASGWFNEYEDRFFDLVKGG